LQVRADLYGHDKEITRILHNERRVADVPVPRSYSNSGSRPNTVASRASRRDDFDSWGSSSSSFNGGFGWGGRGGGFRQSSESSFRSGVW